MANVAVTKADAEAKAKLPVFAELGQRLAAIQRRAFELFERRGARPGLDLDDWFKAEHDILGWPAAELKENEHAYGLQVTLPGFEPKDIEVTATPGEIVVHAKAEHETTTEKDKVVWTEFGSNEVYRKVPLPGPVAIDKITAKLEKGILRIEAPKGAAATAEKKEISVAA